MLDKNIIEKLYLEPLKEIVKKNLNFIQEPETYDGKMIYYEYITIDEKLTITFFDENNADVYWNDEDFMFWKIRNTMVSSDTYDNLVYEELSDLQDPKRMAEIIIRLIRVLYESEFVDKKQTDTGKTTPSGYDRIYDYVVRIKKKTESNKSWKFGNITIVC